MSKKICDSEFPWCPLDAKAGEFYKLRLKDLSPTQYAVGAAEVRVRAGSLRKKFKEAPGKLHDYLRVRPVPIVIRKDRFYLVGHHHLARVLYDALHEKSGKNICVFVKVLGNASSLEEAYFWKTMHQGNWVYLFDEFAFAIDEHGTLERNDDGKEVIDEAMFLASSAEARGLPGFRGPSV